MNVLIVEDVDTMRELLGEVVRGMPGVTRVDLASNGAQARALLLSRRPQWVLLDEVLPGESARDLVDVFAAEGIPILLVTATADARAPLPSGCQARVTKPGWKDIDETRDAWSPHLKRASLNKA